MNGAARGARVAVAQPATGSIAPATDAAVGGDGEVVEASSRHSDDALASQGLDLLRLPLALLATVAQLAKASIAPAPDAVGGDGEAVSASRRHTHGALAAQWGREAGRRVEPRHALAVPEQS